MAIHCSQPYLLVILIIRNQNPEAGCRTPTEHQDTALPPQTISPSSPPPPSHLPNNLETAVCPQINIQCSEPPPPLSRISLKVSTQSTDSIPPTASPGLTHQYPKEEFPPSGKTALALFFPRGGFCCPQRVRSSYFIEMDLVIRKGIFSFSSKRVRC